MNRPKILCYCCRCLSIVGLSFGVLVSSGSATESQLYVDFDLWCSIDQGFQPYVPCDSARTLNVKLRNYSDDEVVEGSDVLSESLTIEVFSAAGELIAWWQPDEDGIPGSGQERHWAPGEEIDLWVIWYFQEGPFEGSFWGTDEEFEQPIAPEDGYFFRTRWHSFDGEVLYEEVHWFDHGPALLWDHHCETCTFDELVFSSRYLKAGVSHTVFVPLFVRIGHSDVHERSISVDPEQMEIVADVTVTGPGSPFWGQGWKYFPLRLPPLERGHYTLRFINADTGRDSWDIHIHDVFEFDDELSLKRPVTQ